MVFIEAGWCADEDETGDVDDCINGQGKARFTSISSCTTTSYVIDSINCIFPIWLYIRVRNAAKLSPTLSGI